MKKTLLALALVALCGPLLAQDAAVVTNQPSYDAGRKAALTQNRDGALFATVTGGGSYTNLTADTAVKSGRGNLVGIFVASSTTCTIKLWDNTAGSGTVLVNTFSAAAATWYPLPFAFDTGLYVDITNTCDVSVSYN